MSSAAGHSDRAGGRPGGFSDAEGQPTAGGCEGVAAAGQAGAGARARQGLAVLRVLHRLQWSVGSQPLLHKNSETAVQVTKALSLLLTFENFYMHK